MTNRPPLRALVALSAAPFWSDELGAMTFALMGRAFAEANLHVLTDPKRR